MRRYGWGALAVVLVAGCVGPRTSLPEIARAPWREVETEHVRVWTDLGEDAAKRTAVELERLRRAVLLIWGPDVNPPEKIHTIVLASHAEFGAFGAERYGGAFAGTPVGAFLFLAAEGGYLLGDAPGSEQTAKHELAHAALYRVLKRQPRWVAEGLASYLQTTHLLADGNVVIGRADEPSLRFVQGTGRVSLAALQAWRTDGALREAELAAYYASSWAWVHFLFNAYPDRFVDYLQRLQTTEDESRAWALAFGGISSEQLERELSVHLPHGRGVLITVPFPGVNEASQVRPLSESNVQVAFALLHLSVPGRDRDARVAEAKGAASEAIRLDPKNLLARRLYASLTGERLPVSETDGTAEVASTDCPTDIERESGLEQALPLRAGDWVPVATADVFGPLPNDARAAVEDHRIGVTLAAGKTALVARSHRGGVRAAVLHELADGACVVNTWATELPGAELVGITPWTAKGGKHAVFLLQLRVAAERQAPAFRWVALGTDGRRLWPALSNGGALHFLAKSATLRPQSGKLYLDVVVKGPGGIVFALRDSGVFEQLGAR